MFKSAIMEVELDDGWGGQGGGVWGKMTKQQTGESKNNKKSNLVELNKVQKQPQGWPWKKDVLINNCSESCQGTFSVKILRKYL